MEVWQNSNHEEGWNLCFETPFNDLEKDMMEDFIGVIRGKKKKKNSCSIA